MKEKYTVLVAEDQIGYRIPIQNFLEDDGFRILLAEDVPGVLRQSAEADVLVVDARLPSWRLEGLDAVATLITEHKLSQEVPVIFISVNDEADEPCQRKLKGLPVLEGRYSWLQKPFELELLVKIIRDRLPACDS